MPSKRGHEASPGGDDLTHREHYGREERRENRGERRDERIDARKHYRGERDEIREEIDMQRAGLTRRLHVKLAELEMLKQQHIDEGLEFELPADFAKIKERIESLGDGEDEGKYEDAFPDKRGRRTAMRNDLQVLRLRVRGMRTSLRRHTSHKEETETAEVEPTPPVEQKPEPKERPPARPPVGPPLPPRAEEPAAPTQPDPEPAEVIPDPKPTRPTPEQIEEEKKAEEDRLEEARKRREEIQKKKKAEELAEEEARKAEEEAARLKEKEKAETEKLYDEAISFLKESKLGERYDDEFIDWVAEKNPDEIPRLSDLLKSDDAQAPETLNKKLDKLFDDYVKDLLSGIDEILVGEFGVDPNDLNDDVELFWKFYREQDEAAFVEDLRNLYEGSGTVEGIAAFESASAVYNSEECLAYRKNEKLHEDPVEWTKDVMKNELTPSELGEMTLHETPEGVIELRLEGSSINLTFEGGAWKLDIPQYPGLIKDGIDMSYESPEAALIDARKILREVVFLDTFMTSVEGRKGYEYNPSQPFSLDSSGDKITFKDSRWWYTNKMRSWNKRGGKYQANHLIDADTVTRALNSAYIEKNGKSEKIPAWKEDKRNAKKHFDKVDKIQSERGLGLNLEANESYTGVTVNLEELNQSLPVVREDNAWVVKVNQPGLISENSLRFDDPNTGLIEAITAARTIIKRTNEIEKTLDFVKGVEDPESHFTLDEDQKIQFNGKLIYLTRGRTPYTQYGGFDNNLITLNDFVNALNFNYLNQKGELDPQNISPQNELEISAWQLNMNTDIDSSEKVRLKHPWKKNHQLEFSEGVGYVDLDDEGTQVKIEKVGQEWTIQAPERYQAALSQFGDMSFESIDELRNQYEMVMPLLINIHNALKKVDDEGLTLDPATLQENGAPFYHESHFTWGNQVLFASENVGALSSDLSRSVFDGRNKAMHDQFSFRGLANALNEIYIKENPEDYHAAMNKDLNADKKPDIGALDDEGRLPGEEPDAWDTAKEVGQTIIDINDQASGL